MVSKSTQFLEYLDDHAVGGSVLTPAVESYSQLNRKRVGLITVEDWKCMEAVHINPGPKSLLDAYESAHLDPDIRLNDRVLVMDFDNYDSQGKLKSQVLVTLPDVLSRLRELSFTLPFCAIQSGTPGNFHLMWVYTEPYNRKYTQRIFRHVYEYWGADTKFNNSVMRNPLYLDTHFPGSVSWWDEWADSAPLLAHPLDLLPDDFDARQLSPTTGSRKEHRGKYKPRMSEKSLVEAMTGAGAGDNRWKMLNSWIIRKIWDTTENLDRFLGRTEVRELAAEGNGLFAEPLPESAVRGIEKYWTRSQQMWYCRRQLAAGAKKVEQGHARAKFIQVSRMKETLEAHLVSGIPLPSELLPLDATYSGRKLAPKKSVCYPYLAHMLDFDDKEYIDVRTGEIRTITAANQVKNILGDGKRAGFTF